MNRISFRNYLRESIASYLNILPYLGNFWKNLFYRLFFIDASILWVWTVVVNCAEIPGEIISNQKTKPISFHRVIYPRAKRFQHRSKPLRITEKTLREDIRQKIQISTSFVYFRVQSARFPLDDERVGRKVPWSFCRRGIQGTSRVFNC